MGAAGIAAGLAVSHINIDLDDWVRKFNIDYHKTKIHKYTYRLCLKNEQAYSHFALTWDPAYSASRNFAVKNPK